MSLLLMWARHGIHSLQISAERAVDTLKSRATLLHPGGRMSWQEHREVEEWQAEGSVSGKEYTGIGCSKSSFEANIQAKCIPAVCGCDEECHRQTDVYYLECGQKIGESYSSQYIQQLWNCIRSTVSSLGLICPGITLIWWRQPLRW